MQADYCTLSIADENKSNVSESTDCIALSLSLAQESLHQGPCVFVIVDTTAKRLHLSGTSVSFSTTLIDRNEP